MAKDITSPIVVQQVASILIPPSSHSSQPYFSDAARLLLNGVILSLTTTRRGEWTFRDVLLIMEDAERMKGVLEASPRTRPLVKRFFSNKGFC